MLIHCQELVTQHRVCVFSSLEYEHHIRTLSEFANHCRAKKKDTSPGQPKYQSGGYDPMLFTTYECTIV